MLVKVKQRLISSIKEAKVKKKKGTRSTVQVILKNFQNEDMDFIVVLSWWEPENGLKNYLKPGI